MDAFTIKDLENLTGIKAHTIRIWEQRYRFLNPQRTETNIRYYSNAELKTALNVALLNKYGYKISHIDRMTPVDINEKILSLTHPEALQERTVNSLIQSMVDMDVEEFEGLLNRCIFSNGIEKTILQIIFPFLERVGMLWLTNHINPAQEHLVTNIIRQKLINGIEAAKSRLASEKTSILFLPEGEHHELGLLFMYFLMKNRGIKVLYLGADMPVKDVAYVVDRKRPDFVYTHLTSVAGNFSLEKFLLNVHHRMPDTQVVVSGQITQHYKKTVPSKISLRQSLPAMMEYINTLS